ncbi:MAG: hypothetical protein AMS16_03165 [Planctomycetes bacterium DG_58]|nr:MAG: hypothetical protein AMS16_03165 [Planctomycetes bacterium DG_58]
MRIRLSPYGIADAWEWKISAIISLAVPEQLDSILADRMAGGTDAPGPGKGDGCIAAFRIGQAGVVMTGLSATVNLNQARNFRGSLRVSVNRCHHRLLPLKDADAVTKHFQYHAVLFRFC